MVPVFAEAPNENGLGVAEGNENPPVVGWLPPKAGVVVFVVPLVAAPPN